MSYLSLKVIHILSAILLFGLGLGTVFYKMMADRSRNTAAIAITSRNVVLADWLFTTPTILIQPLTGFWMAYQLGIPLDLPWLQVSYGLYLLAGVCWLPVVVLQIRMRDLANAANRDASPIPALYYHYGRIWRWLGVPAFFAMTALVAVMVFHEALWS